GATHASLHLIEQEQNALVVAKGPQVPEEGPGHLAHAALTHDRLDHDASGLLSNGVLHSADVAGGDMVEALDRRPAAFKMLWLAPGSDGGEGSPVKRALEGHEAVALGLSLFEVITARHLHRAFNCLGAGIGEERVVGEGYLTESVGQPLLRGD